MLAFAVVIMSFLTKTALSVTSLFNFTASMVAFLFIMVVVLIFIYVYDNLRRGKKTSATTA